MSRTEQLNVFLRIMSRLLAPSGQFHIYVVEQSDDSRKFNIGKLKNVGFVIARRDGYGTFVLSDVDMIPDCKLLPWYRRYPDRPIHLAARGTRYTREMSKKFKGGRTFLGAVAAFNAVDFTMANGYPNDYWGWGGDDDELLQRLHDVGLEVQIPLEGAVLDLEMMRVKEKMKLLKAEHGRFDKRNDARKKHELSWRSNGLSSLEYKVLGRTLLSDHCTKVTVHL